MSEPPLPAAGLERIGETRIFGYDTDNAQWVSIAIDANGRPEVTVYDKAGNQITPATETTLSAVADALVSNANDEVRVSSPNPLDVSAAALEIGTWSAGTLAVAEQNALEIGTWTAGTLTVDDGGSFTIDAVNQGTLPVAEQNALTIGTWNAGTLTTDPSDRSARDLGKARLMDDAGVLIKDTNRLPVEASQTDDHAVENGTSLASGGTLSNALSKRGAERLVGRVVRATTSYDVKLDVLDSAGGTTLFTIDIATGVAAGTETAIDERVESPHVQVRVVDAGGGSGAVTASLHLR